MMKISSPTAAARAWPALTSSSGFTLIELLIVLVITGILLAIAVPSYLGMRTRAADTTAKHDLRSVAVAAEMYASDNIGRSTDADRRASTRGYQGMSTARLRNYNRGIPAALTVRSSKTTVTAYCVRITVSGRTWSARGPGLSATSYKRNANCT